MSDYYSPENIRARMGARQRRSAPRQQAYTCAECGKTTVNAMMVNGRWLCHDCRLSGYTAEHIPFTCDGCRRPFYGVPQTIDNKTYCPLCHNEQRFNRDREW